MNLNDKVKGEYCFCFRSSVLLIFIIGLCLHDVLAKHVSILFALFVFIFFNRFRFQSSMIRVAAFDYLNERNLCEI